MVKNIMLNDNIRLYKRFLKEEGIYARALYIHLNGAHGEKSYYNLDFLKYYEPSNWIQDGHAFCLWRYTSEGDLFWLLKSIYWKNECVKNNVCNQHYAHSTMVNNITFLKERYSDKIPPCDLKRLMEIENEK